MNFFFGYDTYLKDPIDWMFNLNHIMLICFISFVIISLYFSLHAKTEFGKKATKLTLATVMLILEVGRIVYHILHHLHSNDSLEGFNWSWTISFQMCAIMCWTTIATLIASCFVKKDNKVLVIFKNILFGASMLGGFLTFVNPDFLSSNRALLHFVNFQTLTIHILLVFVPIYLVKIGELDVRLKNIWMPVLGFVGITAISSGASQITGNNFAFSLGNPLFKDVGLDVAYPIHLPLTFVIIFVLPIIYYSIFEIVYQRKKSIKSNVALIPFMISAIRGWAKSVFNFKDMTFIDYFYTFAPAIIGIICTILILYIPVWQGINTLDPDFSNRSLESLRGGIVLLPFVALIGSIITISIKKSKRYGLQ